MAKYLDSKEIIESRQKIIDDLDNKVENIRTKARMEREVYKKIVNGKSKKPISLTNQYDGNIISILGGRGFGKSSIAYTFLKELDNKKENIVFDIIDPQKFKSAQDLMLWVIGYFVTWIDYLEKIDSRENRYCEKKNNELKMKFDEVKKHVVLNNSYSNQNLSSMSQSIHDLVEYNQQVSFSNIFFDKKWKDFLECFFYRYKDEINDSNITERNPNEPLLFITIDDADLSSEYGFNILTDINNYFRHPNIVVLVLGDYEEFYQNIYLSYLQNDEIKLDDLKVENNLATEVVNIKKSIREKTSKFLDKILSRELRLSLETLSIDEIYKFKMETLVEDNNKFHESYISVRELLNKEVLKFYADEKEKEMNLGEYLSETKIENYISKDGKNPDHGIFKDYKMLQERDLDKEKKGFDCYVGFQEDCKTFFDDIDSLNSLNKEVETKKNVEYKNKIIERPFLGIFPDNPRDLISFFYEIKDRLNKKDKKLIKLKLEKNEKKKLFDENEKNNQEYLKLLYEILLESLLETEKRQVEMILRVSNNKWIFNFSEFSMAFESYEVKLRDYRIPKGIINFYSKNDGEKIGTRASLLIQLFYDLCMDYIDARIEILGELEFEYGLNEKIKGISENNILYHNNSSELLKDKSTWKVYMEMHTRFRYNYDFIKLYKICIPIVESNKGIPKLKQERLRRCFLYIDYLDMNQEGISLEGETIYNASCEYDYEWIEKNYYNKKLEKRINAKSDSEYFHEGRISGFICDLDYTLRGYFDLSEEEKKLIIDLKENLEARDKEYEDYEIFIDDVDEFIRKKDEKGKTDIFKIRDKSANKLIELIEEMLQDYEAEKFDPSEVYEYISYYIEILYDGLDKRDKEKFEIEKKFGSVEKRFCKIIVELEKELNENSGDGIKVAWEKMQNQYIDIAEMKDNGKYEEYEKIYTLIKNRATTTTTTQKAKLTKELKNVFSEIDIDKYKDKANFKKWINGSNFEF